MIASQPPFTPTPNWKGRRSVAALLLTAFIMHSEVGCLRIFPTAMGRKLTSFLIPANRRAPLKQAEMSLGILPVDETGF